MCSTRPLSRRGLWCLGLAALSGWALPVHSQAAVYPSRPVQLVVAGPAGGSMDGIARMFADAMARQLGQAVFIDNRPGAGGLLAADHVARAASDGHTLMVSWIGNAIGHSLLGGKGPDINHDFAHITQLADGFNVLLVHPRWGVESLPEFLAAARSGRWSYASAGNGSSGHLAMEMLRQRAGLDLLHVPYRGGAAAMSDLAAGLVDAMFVNQDAVLPFLRDRRLVPLAVTSRERSPLMPGLPTVAESGFPGFEATTWTGLSAPRGTPAAVLERLHAAAVLALHGPLAQKQAAIGVQVVGSAPAAFTRFVQLETQKWADVIRVGGIRPG